MRGLLRENQRLGGVAGSLISRLLSSLLGQPQRRELADGLPSSAQAVLTRFDGLDRPLAVFAEVGWPRDPGHAAPFHDRITFDLSMSPIGLLPLARDKTCARTNAMEVPATTMRAASSLAQLRLATLVAHVAAKILQCC
jgi:hypothetical protein